MVFADDDYENRNPDDHNGNTEALIEYGKKNLDLCHSANMLSTGIKYDKENQTLHCYCAKDWWYSCDPSLDDNTCPEDCSQIWVYNEKISSEKWLSLVQSFLSTILWFVLKFWAMLAVLAIVIWWIQISVQWDWEWWGVWKDKIIWWIAALVVLFFAGVILHFVNPSYYIWWWESNNTSVKNNSEWDKKADDYLKTSDNTDY